MDTHLILIQDKLKERKKEREKGKVKKMLWIGISKKS